MSPVKAALTGVSVAALMASGAYAASTAVEAPDDETATVVNKSGHDVDEHAADGQARAAEARATAAARKAEKSVKADDAEAETEAPDMVAGPKEDNGNHGGPDEAAGDHPNENAFLNPQDHEPQGPKPGHTNNAGGLGPDEHAGDHPNEHATSDHKGGKK
jgi:hypothetical protein